MPELMGFNLSEELLQKMRSTLAVDLMIELKKDPVYSHIGCAIGCVLDAAADIGIDVKGKTVIEIELAIRKKQRPLNG